MGFVHSGRRGIHMRTTRMRSSHRFLLLVLLMLAPGGARAQARVCRAADDSSFDMIEMIKSYALATDSIGQAVRDSLRIPAVASAGNVVLITKENTCKSANTAYQNVASGARQTLSGRVYVVQVGTSYVVWDPSYRFDPAAASDVFIVFDSRWARKSIF